MVAINFPDSPTNGQEHSGYVWDANNNVWNRLPTLPALDLVNFSAVAPSNPQDGQFWFDTTAGKMYVYYNDGSSAQWVSTLGGLVGQTGTEGQILVHNGTEWLPSDGISHNAIINGDFGVWQRGTSFTPLSNNISSDRFKTVYNGSGATRIITREAFTPGELKVDGYGDGEFYLRYNHSVAGSGATFNVIQQPVEGVATFAGQEVTISFWAKSSTAAVIKPRFAQQFGSGGSTQVFTTGNDITLTNNWVRYSQTLSLPSISGKTVGQNNVLQTEIIFPLNQVFVVDLWGMQVEAGSVATPFRLAGGGSKAAELALCQRYYWQVDGEAITAIPVGWGRANSSTLAYLSVLHPVTMRSPVSSVVQNGTAVAAFGVLQINITSMTLASNRGKSSTLLTCNVASGLTAGSRYDLGVITGGYLGLSAEL